MKRLFILISILMLFALSLSAQDIDRDREFRMLTQDSTTKAPPKKFKPIGMLGVKYGVSISDIKFGQTINKKSVIMPINISLLYTYYNDLWDMLPNFGLQAELRYAREGFNCEYPLIGNERFELIDLSILSQFRINIDRFRILVNIGPYAGYRLSVEGREWNSYDNRFDYGLIGGAGCGVTFGKMELHLEGNYKFALSSIYHMNKTSEEYWNPAYPRNIIISLALFYHLFD